MTRQQAQLVQQTFNQMATLPAELIGSLFYHRLFAIAPDVRPLFNRTTIPEQSRKLLAILTYIVHRIDQPERLVRELEQLAHRHAQYGVQDRQYDQVGDALLWTLEQGLGEAWTEDVEMAWITCYTFLSEIMLAASSPAAVEL